MKHSPPGRGPRKWCASTSPLTTRMITHVDAQMGRVLKALEESGQAENTIVVFAADNGLAVGSTDYWASRTCTSTA